MKIVQGALSKLFYSPAEAPVVFANRIDQKITLMQKPQKNLWNRPLLAATTMSVSIAVITAMTLYAVHPEGLHAIFCLCFAVFGIALSWYWGIDLHRLDCKIAAINRAKEKKAVPQKNP